MRHWHEAEDEFVYVLAGELTLVEDSGETPLRAGDAAAWRPAPPTRTAWRTAAPPTPPTSSSAPAARTTACTIPTTT